MRILVLALALLPVAAFAEERDPPAPEKTCQITTPQHADRAANPVGPKRLAQEPLGNQYQGVLRKQDGCEVPVQIRQDIGRVQR